MTARRRIPTRERLDIFTRHDGRCYLCGEKLQVGDMWDVEHVLPLELGGDEAPGSENLKPAHRTCHRIKTTVDAWNLAKAKRRQSKHVGAFKSRRPLRNDRWKRKISGETVPR